MAWSTKLYPTEELVIDGRAIIRVQDGAGVVKIDIETVDGMERASIVKRLRTDHKN